MPNHVTNRITAKNYQVIEALTNAKDGEPNFNRIIPCPNSLDFDDRYSVAAEMAAKELVKKNLINVPLIGEYKKDSFNLNERDFDQFLKMIQNKKEYGYFHNMDFAKKKWGTKWNAYGFDKKRSSDTVLVFDTAWNCPHPIFEALSRKFPKEEIWIEYADEDIGSNCGRYKLFNGERVYENIAVPYRNLYKEARRLWTKFAFELRYPDGDPKEYGYNDEWDYSEEVYTNYLLESE